MKGYRAVNIAIETTKCYIETKINSQYSVGQLKLILQISNSSLLTTLSRES